MPSIAHYILEVQQQQEQEQQQQQEQQRQEQHQEQFQVACSKAIQQPQQARAAAAKERADITMELAGTAAVAAAAAGAGEPGRTLGELKAGGPAAAASKHLLHDRAVNYHHLLRGAAASPTGALGSGVTRPGASDTPSDTSSEAAAAAAAGGSSGRPLAAGGGVSSSLSAAAVVSGSHVAAPSARSFTINVSCCGCMRTHRLLGRKQGQQLKPPNFKLRGRSHVTI